jgi:predicted O-methyltransferase YrrM
MNTTEILDALSTVSVKTLLLGLRSPGKVRRYVSHCSKTYDELAGKGLPAKSPVTPAPEATITIPAYHSGGGMSFAELVVLARTTKTRNPRTIFEMGTYNGLTTAVFMLNSAPGTTVITLDLPPAPETASKNLSSDNDLISTRDLASVPRALGLDRYTQLLCDSTAFDPAPYADSVDLGLVDAAHDRLHVENDTVKMATMIKEDGIVFWHDYGGKGALRPLASYLENLATRCPIYRIAESLAWAPARGLKAILRPE